MNKPLFAIDESNGYYYIQKMSATALLIKEIETMPEAAAAEVLDFAKYIKSKHTQAPRHGRIATKDAYGLFKGINTHFERDEDDRI